MVEAIAAATAAQPQALPAALPVAEPGTGFATWFADELGTVNGSLVNVDHQVQKMALGETGNNLHEVMISMEEAKLQFQLLAQVRNHLLDAYQEVMRTQV